MAHYTSQDVTVHQPQTRPRRYCHSQVCSPDVPESIEVTQPDRHTIGARSIKASHLGRGCVGVWALLSVYTSVDGNELARTSGVSKVPLDGRANNLTGQHLSDTYTTHM